MFFLKKWAINFPPIRNILDDRIAKETRYEFMPLFAPDAILDFGAHKGYVTEALAKRFYTVPVHAYECNLTLFKVLKKNTNSLSNVVCFPEAIGEVSDTRDFYISDRNFSSSLIPTEGKKVKVSVVPISTAISRISGDRIFIKMDIEGVENFVLDNLDRRIKDIVGEVHPDKSGRTNASLKETLENQGFTVFLHGENRSTFRAYRQ